jgi:hypothetical protein
MHGPARSKAQNRFKDISLVQESVSKERYTATYIVPIEAAKEELQDRWGY